MSWDILLRDPETQELVEVPRFEAGGTYAIGGTIYADLNVTYNYTKHYHFDHLDGQVAGDMIKEMQEAVMELGVVTTGDYWDPVPGNVGFALNILLGWARLHPTAVFEVH